MARIIFFGTPAIAVPTLTALHDAGHEIALVVSQADKRRGRSSALSPSPVKAAALERNIRVTDRVKDVLDTQADVGVLVAFGRLIKPEILDYLEIVNLHPSLLPRWRGATPGEAAILAGDTATGICLMRLVEEMDAGPIYAKATTQIGERETSAQLYDRLFHQGNELLLTLLEGKLPEPVAQVGEPTFCGKTTSEDFHIDWNRSAEHISRITRVGQPWTTFRAKRVKVLSAVALPAIEAVSGAPGSLQGNVVATGIGALLIEIVQPEGKAAMDAKAWLNGVQPKTGETFE